MAKKEVDYKGHKVSYQIETDAEHNKRLALLERLGTLADCPSIDYRAGDRALFVAYQDGYTPESDELVIPEGNEILLTEYDPNDGNPNWKAVTIIDNNLEEINIYYDEITTIADDAEGIYVELQDEEEPQTEETEIETENIEEQTEEKEEPAEAKKEPKKITPKKGRKKAVNAEEKKEEAVEFKDKPAKRKGRPEKQAPSTIMEDINKAEAEIKATSLKEQQTAEDIKFSDLDDISCDQLIKMYNGLETNISAGIYESTRILACIKYKQLYLEKGFDTFEDFCRSGAVDVRYPTAMCRIKVYTRCEERGITKETFCEVGYTFLREKFAYLTDDESVEKLLDIKRRCSSNSEIDREIRTVLTKGVEEKEEKESVFMRFSYHNQEGEYIKEALKEIKEAKDDVGMSDSEALYQLVQELTMYKNASTTIQDDLEYLSTKADLPKDKKAQLFELFGVDEEQSLLDKEQEELLAIS